jgi:pyruvate formate lyase activating enzyme
MMQIGGLQRTTLIDFPGRLAATVFLCGCNFRCPFCYSSELVLPEKIKEQPKISFKEFFDFLKERKGLLEGVVICGGEPTIHKDLDAFIKKIKDLGYAVKLDTNGSNPAALKRLFRKKLLDYVAMDIKAALNFKEYGFASGNRADLKKIKQSIDIIKNSGVDYEFRTTVVPGIHNKKEINKIIKALSPLKMYYLQNFKPEKTLKKEFERVKPYTREFLGEIKKEVEKISNKCSVR